MSKTVFTSGSLNKVLQLKDFTMTVKGRAVVNTGVDLTQFLENQRYSLTGSKEGEVLELTIDTVTEQSSTASILPTNVVIGAPATPAKKTMSDAARKKISDAVKARWAKTKKAAKKAAKAPAKKVKHSMSAEAKKKISIAIKAAWEKKRAAAQTSAAQVA
jgi:hypothetical protein